MVYSHNFLTSGELSKYVGEPHWPFLCAVSPRSSSYLVTWYLRIFVCYYGSLTLHGPSGYPATVPTVLWDFRATLRENFYPRSTLSDPSVEWSRIELTTEMASEYQSDHAIDGLLLYSVYCNLIMMDATSHYIDGTLLNVVYGVTIIQFMNFLRLTVLPIVDIRYWNSKWLLAAFIFQELKYLL